MSLEAHVINPNIGANRQRHVRGSLSRHLLDAANPKLSVALT